MALIEKRYQVFVSSTYRDLMEERREVMQALLELDCIPAGMEMFQAANEDQFTLIKRVIDDSDYYLVIMGGRYGSLGASDMSFTEMEYRYAVERGKPVMAFLHERPERLPQEHTEIEPEARERLQRFRRLCETRMVRYWYSPQNLAAVVSRSIVRMIRDHPASGWIRGSLGQTTERVDASVLERKIADLEASLRSRDETIASIKKSEPNSVVNFIPRAPQIDEATARSAIEDKVKLIVVEHSGLEQRTLSPTYNLESQGGLDSLDAVELLMAFEEAFDIEIPDEAGEKIRTIPEITTTIANIIKQQAPHIYASLGNTVTKS